jgi:hypothetical protein
MRDEDGDEEQRPCGVRSTTPGSTFMAFSRLPFPSYQLIESHAAVPRRGNTAKCPVSS